MSDAYNGENAVLFATGIMLGAVWVHESWTATDPLVYGAAAIASSGLVLYAYVEGQR